MKDEVNPDHYKMGGMEAIDIIESRLTEAEFQGYLKGSALKYMLRADAKGEEITDRHKAKWFIDRLLSWNDWEDGKV